MTNKKGDQGPEKSSEPDTAGGKLSAKNRGWPKGKRRYPKGAGAPKQPLSGYVHYLNERREVVRTETPEITFSELSKKLAAEWSNLPEDEKLKYNEMAKKDKDRYEKEFAEYQTTEQYKNFLESQKELNSSMPSTPSSEGKAKKKKKAAGPVVRDERNSLEDSDGEMTVAEPHTDNTNSFDIPIFTEEFLDHNKARELELKQLRKQTGEFEEQNAVLGKHIESMKSAIAKLEVETVQQRQVNAGLQHQLDQMRQLVVTHFRGVSVPGVDEPLTPLTADQYIAALVSQLDQDSAQSGLANSVKDIIANMDFSQIVS